MSEQIFTKEQLASFDGLEGRKAYVAIDGIVYDVTEAKGWKTRVHHGNKAGNDVTAGIARSPHGLRVLEKLPVVGKLQD